MDEFTEWRASMTAVLKPNGNVCICVDLSKLNEIVQRQPHVLFFVEHTLAQLHGVKVFRKLDAKQQSLQILCQKTAKLTTLHYTI